MALKLGKASGGVLNVTPADGVTSTNLVLPESGTVATLSNIHGFKNLIINGRKQVNQRGLTATDNAYNQDRWYKAGNNWFQGIEGDNNLINGKTYTLSWVGSATTSYYVGNETSSTINSQTFTPIANGGTFTLTISAGQNLWVKFVSDSIGSTFNFVQLEEGSVATPFENRPYGLELSLCKRYLPSVEVTQAYVFSGGFLTSTYGFAYVQFEVEARVSPTGILLSTSNVRFVNPTSGEPIGTGIVFAASSKNGCQVTSSGATAVGGQATCLTNNTVGSTKILFTGCEI